MRFAFVSLLQRLAFAGLLGLAPADLPDERRAELVVFIQAFERITRSMLAGGVRADVTVQLDRYRRPFSP
ncbi:hypothetical protein D3C71_2099930 [compost metagenome]